MTRRKENIFFRDSKGFKAAKKKLTGRLTAMKGSVNMTRDAEINDCKKR